MIDYSRRRVGRKVERLGKKLLRRTVGRVMTSSADRTINALRATHEELAAAVRGLSDEQVVLQSAASEWTVAQVLSHLGSGAEISLASLRSTLADEPAPGSDFNQSVWDRWNALSPTDQAADFLISDETLVSAVEALSADQREGLRVRLGFLPAPLSLAAYVAMRLNEAAQHSWDVRVSFDPDAVIAADTAVVLAQHFAGELGFLLGFTGKADALAHPTVVDIQRSGFAVVVADTVSLGTEAPEPTAAFTGPLEAAMRLLSGRLTPAHTADDIDVTGNVSLDDLRRVFPGY